METLWSFFQCEKTFFGFIQLSFPFFSAGNRIFKLPKTFKFLANFQDIHLLLSSVSKRTNFGQIQGNKLLSILVSFYFDYLQFSIHDL